MDAIKFGIPGNPWNLKAAHGGQNDPHVRWTLIGLEEQLWGKSCSLGGQVGMVACFGDALSAAQAKLLHTLGPSQGLGTASDDDPPEVADLLGRVVFFYSARAAHNCVCPNLHSPGRYEAHVTAEPHCTQDIKDVVNCIGGIQVLFPLLETAATEGAKDETSDECDGNTFASMRSESREGEGAAKDADWELVPASSFSDWKLEQNPVSGFLTLVKNFVFRHTVNLEQLMRGGGVAVIGSLLIRARSSLIDVNVLMAAQLLVELAHASRDSRLLSQIYQSVLFDFRIWARSEFHVQIGHVQYISTIARDDRKFFRKKFGVQFLLDVIRKHYGASGCALSREDAKTMRASLFGLIRFYLTRDVTWREVHPIVGFLQCCGDRSDTLARELCEVTTQYLEGRHAKDQMFLVMYESRRADLLYSVLLDQSLAAAGHVPQLRAVRLAVLRLLSTLLRSNKVSTRHKYRMHLAECRYLGFLHLWFKPQPNATSPVEVTSQKSLDDGGVAAPSFVLPNKEEILLLLDQMMLFDDAATFQGVVGLCHHLQWAPLDVKLEVARRVMSFMFSRPDVPSSVARQVGWQDCLTKLLVKKTLKLDDESEEEARQIASAASSSAGEARPSSRSPAHLIGRAAGSAKQYLPQQAGEAMDKLTAAANKAGKKVTDARDKASDTVLMAQSAIALAVGANQILDKVQTGIDDLALGAASAGRRKYSTSSLTASFSAASDETKLHAHVSEDHAELDLPQRPLTPQYLQSPFHLFEEDLTAGAAVKSASASSEDVSISRAETTCSTPTKASSEDVPDIEIVDYCNDNEGGGRPSSSFVDEERSEEELCQLVINVLFTVMWRGVQGVSEEAVRERGQVIACINMLGLNNELYRSYVELKRRLIEMCVQAALSDFRDRSVAPASPESFAVARHVMQWVYDLVVFESPGNFPKKVNETLLDGVIGMVESLAVFRDSSSSEEGSVGAGAGSDIAKLAFEVLLKCAESHEETDGGEVLEGICTMAVAKLHALVQTRSASPVEESAYLIQRLDGLVKRVLGESGELSDRYSMVANVMRALLDKSREALSLTTQLPSLNLREAASFFDEFRAYSCGEEWRYFLEKRIAPLSDSYQSGFLRELPREMDVFWAECFETSKVGMHRRAREVGESKLRFQTGYAEPFAAAARNEGVRYNNGLSQQNSHLAFIEKRWRVSKRLYFGPRGAWSSLEGKAAVERAPAEYWRLAANENFMRMRMKLVPNANYDPHLDASAHRDNVRLEDLEVENKNLLEMQISKEAVGAEQSGGDDDSLTEEELKSIAKQQMETASLDAASGEGSGERSAEKLIMSEDCQLVTFMSVVRGKFELTTSYVYFFDSSPYR